MKHYFDILRNNCLLTVTELKKGEVNERKTTHKNGKRFYTVGVKWFKRSREGNICLDNIIRSGSNEVSK